MIPLTGDNNVKLIVNKLELWKTLPGRKEMHFFLNLCRIVEF